METARTTTREAAVEEMMTHGNTLYRYAISRVGDKTAAEDLVQETLVSAVKNLSGYQGEASMRTWLIGILRHKILDHYRWKTRHPGDQPAADDISSGDTDPWFTKLGVWRTDPNDGLEALEDDPSRAVERSQLREALRFCIEHLPRSLYRVFVLRELEELEPEETCETAGISRDSLAVLLYRSRQSLRACLQKKWVAS